MLVISVELWPHGDRGQAKQIASAQVANTGTGDLEHGNYTASFFTERRGRMALVSTAQLKGFLRQQKNSWDLLAELLQKREVANGRKKPKR